MEAAQWQALPLNATRTKKKNLANPNQKRRLKPVTQPASAVAKSTGWQTLLLRIPESGERQTFRPAFFSHFDFLYFLMTPSSGKGMIIFSQLWDEPWNITEIVLAPIAAS